MTMPAYSTGPTQVAYGNTPQIARMDAAAVVAFILALSSLLFWFVPAIVALVLAPQARKSIVASEGTRKGLGLARAAQVIAVLALIITVTATAALTLAA